MSAIPPRMARWQSRASAGARGSGSSSCGEKGHFARGAVGKVARRGERRVPLSSGCVLMATPCRLLDLAACSSAPIAAGSRAVTAFNLASWCVQLSLDSLLNLTMTAIACPPVPGPPLMLVPRCPHPRRPANAHAGAVSFHGARGRGGPVVTMRLMTQTAFRSRGHPGDLE
jgi:hypothetical protein